MREQDGWDEHARYMDDLAESGFALLVGPIDGDREVVWVVAAGSEDEVRERLAQDPWAASGMLTPTSVEGWTIVIDARVLSA
jgi:uncharacterized protein YciI